MTRIAHATICPPKYPLTAPEVEAGWSTLVGNNTEMLAGLRKLIGSAAVAERQLVAPVDKLIVPRTAGKRNREFIAYALEYGEKCLRKLLDETGVEPASIDALITVSCTGLMIPSVDAYLLNRIGINKKAVRLPITELGCAAGAFALSRADDFLRARPGGKVILLALEFPSLTMNVKNLELVNLVSSVLFGDGAAAVLLDDAKGPGLRIRATRSELYPDTEYLMGFDLSDDGLQVILDRDVPATVKANIRRSVVTFLEEQGVTQGSLAYTLLHPGGRKLVDHIEEELGLSPAMTALSRNVLRDHGNMSSATILYVIERFLREQAPGLKSGSQGLIAAMGPGFSVEQLLTEWAAA